ncbi:Putative FAD/NAD(P)-binding domain superfamily [Colletotrichum destructivum]|uniref:FAD/NAD(P)-binding domain superfamily n=1 Tax=Colletotrichum destructivum TaxID=34406 RepID=A0AAX4IXH5_9PEZI|nr:Putative FAD/NAD(P)-binding domain superfamily [Colletotrichum destructivum]
MPRLATLQTHIVFLLLTVCWESGGIGIATAPDFWKVFHRGNVIIHSTEIESVSHQDVVNLKNGYAVATDIVIHCTGFDEGYRTFDSELQEELGLQYDTKTFSQWTMLDEKAKKTVDELLPYLWTAPEQYGDVDASRGAEKGPNRHSRRLVIPKLAARCDRSILFPGHIHSAFTPLAAELQALWGVSCMPDGATFRPERRWSLKRRHSTRGPERGTSSKARNTRTSYPTTYRWYFNTLMKDLGISPFRKGNVFEEWCVRCKPSGYRTILDEYRSIRRHRLEVGSLDGHAKGSRHDTTETNGHSVKPN